MIFFLSPTMRPALSSSPSEDLLNALQHLADSRRCGLNEILGERDVLRAASVCEGLSRAARAVYAKLSETSSQMRHLIDRCELYVCVTEQPTVCERETVSGQERIVISVEHVARYQRLSQQPILLCENLDDCVFLTWVGSLYRDWNKLPNMLRFDNRNGGGHTTAQVYESILQEREALCLCISDSDLKYEGDTRFGATAVALRQVNECNDVTLADLHILECQDCENMIPASILCDVYSSDPNKLQVCADIRSIQENPSHQLWRYYDIKDGLRTFELLNPVNSQYQASWLRIFGSVPDIISGNCSGCPPHSKCEEKRSCTVYLAKGLGTGVLGDTIDSFFSKRSAAEVRRRIPARMMAEWNAIGRLVWTWGTVGFRMAS